MIILDVEQGTADWHAVRCGRCTASRITDVTAKGKSGPSAMRANYLAELVVETLMGTVAMDGYVSPAMKRGSETEAEARDLYAFRRNVEPRRVGFVVHPRWERMGCSPDSLIGDDGMLEIKCPNTSTHIDTLLGASIDGKYVKQMQFQMACTGSAWVDFISFDNRLPAEMQLHTRRVNRDDAMIAELEREADVFLREVADTVRKLRQRYQIAEAA